MANNQENEKQTGEILGLGVSNQGQNLGGGKEQATARQAARLAKPNQVKTRCI